MKQIVLATTKPLNYDGTQLGKTPSSLRKVAKRKSIPLVLEHDGPKVGAVTNLTYEFKNGIGYLLGQVQDLMGKMGASLQYTGAKIGNEIQIKAVDHVALVDDPRDPVALFSDSTNQICRYRDSVEGVVEPVPPSEDPADDPEDPSEPPQTNTTEIELTEEVLALLYQNLFENPDRLSDLVSRIEGLKSTKQDTDPEPAEDGPTSTPPLNPPMKTRIIVKPRVASDPTPKKTAPPIQRPFKGLL